MFPPARPDRWFSRAWVALVVGCLAFSLPGPHSNAADSPTLTVHFGETRVTHHVMAVLAMPDTTVSVSVRFENAAGPYHLDGPAHQVHPLSETEWHVQVPDRPGLFPLTLTDSATDTSIRLQVFVLDPWDHEGRSLNGYRIGHYEEEPREDQARYEQPTGFVRVTDANQTARVSPHFRLDQFLCKQTDETPQYALVQPRLLRALEGVLTALHERGHRTSTLHVMSGYRTPYYNRAIGNSTEYSRHLYGDAADVFVDEDGDGWMDDLTGDGQGTIADAEYLAAVVRTVPTEEEDAFVGGLSTYGPATDRGPFVHIDLRGENAEW